MKPTEKLIGDLKERAKELRCLYEVEKALNVVDRPVAEAMAAVVEVIGPGWQYPEVCGAAVTLEGLSVASASWAESPWRLVTDIRVHGEVVGKLSVCYTAERPDEDDGPFLKEEVQLLGSLADPPPEVDYSFNADFTVDERVEDSDGTLLIPVTLDSDPKELFANARVELWACDQLVDSVVYAELPSMGTYAYDGALPPDAEGNDDPTRWCTDATPAPEGGPQTELGLPGSPGEVNPPCG